MLTLVEEAFYGSCTREFTVEAGRPDTITSEKVLSMFGSGGKRVVDLLQPMTSIVWNVDSEDWKSHDKDMIIEQVLSHLQPKSVILMHDTHISTVEAIDVLIPMKPSPANISA